MNDLEQNGADRTDGFDPDGVTDEIPVVPARRQPGEGTMIWLLLGAVIGIGVLAVFAGGFRFDGSTATAPAVTRVPTTAPEPEPVPTTSTATTPAEEATPPQTRVVLQIEALAPSGVFMELRRRDPSGPSLFAGTIPQGERRRFAIPVDEPLWMSLAWAPSAKVLVGGAAQDTSGGTESYLVNRDGIERLTGGPDATTTSR